MVGRGRKLWRTTYVKLRRFGSEPILDRFWTDFGPERDRGGGLTPHMPFYGKKVKELQKL